MLEKCREFRLVLDCLEDVTERHLGIDVARRT
jgi:hypothetical protein